jgi:cbb3-type cytochrome oxidase maturation protein
MSVIVVLIAASLLTAAGFMIAFIWAVKSGQMDDLHTPALRILWDEGKYRKTDPPGKANNLSGKRSKNAGMKDHFR